MIVVTIMAKVEDQTPTTIIKPSITKINPIVETMKVLESIIITLMKVVDHHRDGD